MDSPLLGVIAGLSAKAWREDVDALETTLTLRHPEPFHHVSREALHRHCQSLTAQPVGLGERSPEQRLLGLLATPPLLGDGHTRVRGTFEPTDKDELSTLPIRLYLYKDGLHVRATHPEWGELLGLDFSGSGKQTAPWFSMPCYL
jgi:hypothetical protein